MFSRVWCANNIPFWNELMQLDKVKVKNYGQTMKPEIGCETPEIGLQVPELGREGIRFGGSLQC